MSIGTAIVITSGKGGTGKTSTAAGVAACLAAMGKRTLCIDADIGLRNLDLTLGMTDQALMDFTDVIQGRCSLEKGRRRPQGASEPVPHHRPPSPSPPVWTRTECAA